MTGESTHYGFKLGDTVAEVACGRQAPIAVVVALPPTDKNKLVVEFADGSRGEYVAEWCMRMGGSE